MTTSETPRFVPRSGESWRDPFAMYRALRDYDPVHHVPGGDYWVLSRFEHVMAAVRDTTTYSSAQGLTFRYDELQDAGLTEIRPLVFLDPPDHTAFRRLVSKGFTPRHVQQLEGPVRSFVSERLDRIAGTDEVDIVGEVLKPLPTYVVAHYLGVPEADRGRFDGWVHSIVAATAGNDPGLAAGAIGEVFDYFSALIERRRHEPGDDTISHLVTDGVDPLQILGFAFTMITGGNDTTTGLLGVGLTLLAEAPDERRRLAADPSRIDRAVHELLRLTSPVQGLARTVTRDVEIEGVTIPAGRKVLLLYGSANRDERQFGADADLLRIDRDSGQHLAFSLGAHHCLGAAAARLMARVTLNELLARFPDYAVDAASGEFAPGNFVRWYSSLPLRPRG